MTGLPNYSLSYEEAANKVEESAFGAFPLYAKNLRELGHEVEFITPNNRHAQLIWARRDNLRMSLSKPPLLFSHWEWFSRIPIVGSLVQKIFPVGRILEHQLLRAGADLVLVGDLSLLSASQIRRIKKLTGAVIFGQIAAPLPSKYHYKSYDLIFSAHPGIVSSLQRQNVAVRYLPLAFGEPDGIEEPLPFDDRRHTAAFIGSFGLHHRVNYQLLAALKESCPDIEIYGNPNRRKLASMGLEGNYKGRVFGREMLEIYGRVKVGINRHARFADRFAVNMRMFEVTGRGAVLLTESFENLSDLFPKGALVAYSSPESAAELLKRLLNGHLSGKEISSLGMTTTRTQHTYMKRSLEILKEFEARK